MSEPANEKRSVRGESWLSDLGWLAAVSWLIGLVSSRAYHAFRGIPTDGAPAYLDVTLVLLGGLASLGIVSTMVGTLVVLKIDPPSVDRRAWERRVSDEPPLFSFRTFRVLRTPLWAVLLLAPAILYAFFLVLVTGGDVRGSLFILTTITIPGTLLLGGPAIWKGGDVLSEPTSDEGGEALRVIARVRHSAGSHFILSRLLLFFGILYGPFLMQIVPQSFGGARPVAVMLSPQDPGSATLLRRISAPDSIVYVLASTEQSVVLAASASFTAMVTVIPRSAMPWYSRMPLEALRGSILTPRLAAP